MDAGKKLVRTLAKLRVPFEVITISTYERGVMIRFKTDFKSGCGIEIGDSLLKGLFVPQNRVVGWIRSVRGVEVELFIYG